MSIVLGMKRDKITRSARRNGAAKI